MPKATCVDCGGEAEQVYEFILKPFRSKTGKVRRWKGGLCEECLRQRFDGLTAMRPL